MNNDILLSHDDDHLAETFEVLGENPTLEAFTDAIAETLERYGFTDFSLTMLGLVRREQISTLLDGTDTTHALIDVVQEHFQNDSSPLFLSTVEKHIADYPIRSSRIADCAHSLKQLGEKGFREGYIIIHTAKNGRRYLFTVYSRYKKRNDVEQLVKAHREHLILLLESILSFGKRYFPVHFSDGEAYAVLSKPKPKRLLELVAKEGLKLKDAAPVLGVKLDTVNRYCADLKKSLGCRSMPQVIYRVYSGGLIAPPEKETAAPPLASLDNDPLPANSDGVMLEGAGGAVALNEKVDQGHFFSVLAGCETIHQFRQSVLSIVYQLGFTDFFFTALDAPSDNHLSSLPEEMRDFYRQEAFAHVDFCREHAADSSIPVFLSELKRFTAGSRLYSERILWHKAYFQLLDNLGYQDGYCIPHSAGYKTGRVIFLLFARKVNQTDFHIRVERYQSLLPMLVGAIVYFGVAHFPEHFFKEKVQGINPRALKTFSTVIKEGLTMKEAERRLYMSEFTANEHVNNVKKVLGAKTLMNAAYLAMVQGVIKVEDEDERE